MRLTACLIAALVFSASAWAQTPPHLGPSAPPPPPPAVHHPAVAPIQLTPNSVTTNSPSLGTTTPPGPRGLSLSVAMNDTLSATGSPAARTATVTATATDAAGFTNIVIKFGTSVRATCSTSPCSATIKWNVTTASHTIYAVTTTNTGNEIHTANVKFPY